MTATVLESVPAAEPGPETPGAAHAAGAARARPEAARTPAPRRRGGVLAAGGALLLAVWSVVAGLAALEHHRAIETIGQRNALHVRVFADEVSRDVEAVAQASASLVALLERGVAADGAEMRGNLAQLQLNLPWLRGMAVVDAGGRVIASTAPHEIGRSVPMSAFGRWPAAGAARLGAPVDGRGLLDAGTGQAPPGVSFLPMLQVATPPGGAKLAVIASINAQSFANAEQTRLDDQSSAAALLGYDGRLVAASAQVPQRIGSSLAELPPFRQFLPAQESGSWTGTALRAGVQMAAFRASSTRPLVAVVETDRDAALAPWRQLTVALVAGGLLASALIGGLTLLTARSQAARALAQVERDQAQREVARRERAFDLTLRSVQALIFRTDADGRLRFVNPGWQALTGRAPGDAIGETLWPLVVPEQRAQARALFDAAGGREARRLQARVVDPSGRTRSLEVTVQPLWQERGLVGFVGSAVDVSERVEAETALHAQLAFTELLMDSSPLPMSLVDDRGRYARVNRAWEAFTGRRREQDIGRPVGQHLSAAERALHEAHDRALHASGEPQRYETGALHADGSLRDVLISKVLLPSESGPGAAHGAGGAVLSVLVDVTDLRRAERATREARDAAEEASRAKSEFIANISHELRTPLQSIIGFAELGGFRGRAHEKLAGMFGDIHAAGQRMLELVNNLLDVAKLESAVGSIHLERADLRGIVHELLRELDPLLQARGQAVDLGLPDYPLVAKVDPLRMQQVLRNVLANAMKFSPPGSRIRLDGDYNERGEPHLSVRDAGPGIPVAELEKIFEAFAQSTRTKDGSGGTGLGLAICRTIVAAHGGCIHAENAPDGGAVFHILLPSRGSVETQPMTL